MRLDLKLVDMGSFTSRSKAKEAIIRGCIFVDGKKIIKPNFDITNQVVEVREVFNPYVSKGGLKLEKALKFFDLSFENKIILDIGASTGGFTDCSLKNGALKVYAIDVGSNQLVDSLKSDKRVFSLEKTNFVKIDKEFFKEKIDYIVMDVSFTSIKPLIEHITNIFSNFKLICLIKPQFEMGKMFLKNGVVKDKKIHIKVLKEIENFLNEKNLYINNLTYSPIKGGSGNIEFLALISFLNYKDKDIVEVVKNAHRELK